MNHLSNTSVSMMLRCPRQYYYRYILGLKVPPGVPLIFGSTYHYTLEENFVNKINTGTDLSPGIVTTIFSDQWDRDSEAIDWRYEGEDKGEVKDTGVSLIDTYMHFVAPLRSPVSVEIEFDLDLTEFDIDSRFVGRMDFVGPNDTVLEHKSAGRSWSQSRADTAVQVDAYMLAYKKMFGRRPSMFMYDIGVRAKVPKIQQITTNRTEHTLTEYIERLRYAEYMISEEIFPKCDPQINYLCNPKWCGYYDHCKRGVPLGQLRLLTTDKQSLSEYSGL